MFAALKELLFGTTVKTKILVTFVNHLDGSIIESFEEEQYNLPEDFTKVDTLTLFDQEWTIVRAEPSHANQYSFSKKLTLRIMSKDMVNGRKSIDHPVGGTIKFGKNSGEGI